MSGKRLTVLILGGYGTFGGRLAELLADESRLTLVIAGRSRDKAAAFCARLPRDGAVKRPLAFDRGGDVEQQLRAAAPDLVVDATGPFQSYGPSALSRGRGGAGPRHRLSRPRRRLRFRQGHRALRRGGARARRVRALGRQQLSGPDRGRRAAPRPRHGRRRVRSRAASRRRLLPASGRTSSAPSPAMPASPWRCRRDGRATTRHALTEGRRYTIAPPGRLPLDPILFSLVDVPDLLVLPDLWPGVRTVWMGAGPVPEILHRALNALAWAVRLRLLPSLAPFAGLMYRVINILRWGEHRGGMFVAVDGPAAPTAGPSRDHGISWPRATTGRSSPRWRPRRSSARVSTACTTRARRASRDERSGAHRL